MISSPTSPNYKRRFWTGVAGTILVLTIVGIWTNHAVHETMEWKLREGLQTVLEANLKALEIWLDNERQLVTAWAGDRGLAAQVARLVPLADGPAEGLKSNPAQEPIRQTLEGLLGENDLIGFAVVALNGRLIAADQPEYIGRRVDPRAGPWLERVRRGETLLRRPFAKNRLVGDLPPEKDRPIMISAAPIFDDPGQVLAALVFSIDPEEDFSRILRVGRMGRSGETYAFDRNGLMLSESRFDDQLRQLGLIPDRPGSTSLLQLQLHDPGGDLTRGYRPQLPRSEQPLPRLVRQAAVTPAGIDLDGYRDYRGVTVVGAWRWLDKYQFGLATEADRDEALLVLRPVRIAFWGLMALILAISIALMFASRITLKLQRRIEHIRRLGQYTLQEKIGEGGMGSVYKASHALLRRPTAIKLIREDRLDPEALQRFEKEVQATSQLNHPNTLAIYDYGHSPAGIFYYAMEYISGLTLSQLVTLEGQVPPARVIHLLRQACGPLAEAHGRGLLHRDIKPGNIMLCRRGGSDDVVKVLDFGLVQQLDGQPTGLQPIHGTPDYIAPERLISGRKVDTRSDLYSLGAVGFYLLTGQPVFVPTPEADLLQQVIQAPPPDPAVLAPATPTELANLILACLAKEPDRRPASALILAEQLATVPLAQTWSTDDAAGWWREHRAEIQRLRYADRTTGGTDQETVAGQLLIDLGQRPGQTFQGPNH